MLLPLLLRLDEVAVVGWARDSLDPVNLFYTGIDLCTYRT